MLQGDVDQGELEIRQACTCSRYSDGQVLVDRLHKECKESLIGSLAYQEVCFESASCETWMDESACGILRKKHDTRTLWLVDHEDSGVAFDYTLDSI